MLNTVAHQHPCHSYMQSLCEMIYSKRDHLDGERQKEGSIICSAVGCRSASLCITAMMGAAIPNWLAKFLNIRCSGDQCEAENQSNAIMM